MIGISPWGAALQCLHLWRVRVCVQDATGGGYTQYGEMLKTLAQHEAFKLNVTVYKQIWNEPDLTNYFNYSAGGTTFFAGTNSDYNQMYEEASLAMLVGR